MELLPITDLPPISGESVAVRRMTVCGPGDLDRGAEPASGGSDPDGYFNQ